MPFDAFVVFVDMLGFADLVEAEGDEISDLNPIFQGVELYSPSPGPSLLGYRFINFHRCLQTARATLQHDRSGTVIVFSDSAFFALESLDKAISLARSLMFSLVVSDVPARMGIAHGSFRSLRFASDTSERCSSHMSQFLGTGVVRAYRTERCGLPGLRVLLHPDLEQQLDKVSLRITAVGDSAKLALPVQSQVNYLEVKSDALLGPDYDDCLVFDSLRNMTAEADQRFHYHYIATYHALNMMRTQLGRSAYPWDKFLDREAYDAKHGIRPPALPRDTD